MPTGAFITSVAGTPDAASLLQIAIFTIVTAVIWELRTLARQLARAVVQSLAAAIVVAAGVARNAVRGLLLRLLPKARAVIDRVERWLRRPPRGRPKKPKRSGQRPPAGKTSRRRR